MSTDNEYTRIEAILALSGLDSPEAEEQLLKAIDDPDLQIRKAALKVLGESFDSKFLMLFMNAFEDKSLEIRKVAAEYLLEVGDEDIRNSIINKLGENYQSDYTPLLVHVLQDDCFYIKEAAENILIFFQDHKCIEPLLRIAKDKGQGKTFRSSAIRVLSNFDVPEVLDDLYALLGDEAVGLSVAISLDKSYSHTADNLFLKALNDPNGNVRQNAIRGIANNGDRRILQELCRMFTDKEPIIKHQAAFAILRIIHNIRIRAKDDTCWETEVSIAVEPLMRTFQDNDEDIRELVLEALGCIGSPLSVSLIMSALDDPSSRVFSSAVLAMGEMKCTEALDTLLGLLKSAPQLEENSRLTIIMMALGKLGDQRACESLAHLLNSDNREVRIDAASVLLELGDTRGWELLVATLADRDIDQWCRRSIAESIANSSDPRSLDVLLNFIEQIKFNVESDLWFLESLLACLVKFEDSRAMEAISKWRHLRFNFRTDAVVEAFKKLSETDQEQTIKY